MGCFVGLPLGISCALQLALTGTLGQALIQAGEMLLNVNSIF